MAETDQEIESKPKWKRDIAVTYQNYVAASQKESEQEKQIRIDPDFGCCVVETLQSIADYIPEEILYLNYLTQTKQSFEAAREFLEKEIGKEQTDQKLIKMEDLIAEQDAELDEVREAAAPAIKARLKNFISAINKSPYRRTLPRMLELDSIEGDGESHFSYLPQEGELIKSSLPVRRNLFRRVIKDPLATKATDVEFVKHHWEIETAIVQRLPTGWRR